MAAKRGYRYSKNKKALPKYVKKMVKQANKRLDEWRNNGLTSNEERLAGKMLEDFYNQAGKKIKDPNRANERIRLTREQQQEFIAILNYIKLEVDTPSERDYKNKAIRDKWEQMKQDSGVNPEGTYEWYKEHGYVEDEQDFVDFIDDLNRLKSNVLLSDILDSKQIRELMYIGASLGLSQHQVETIIIETYNRTGKTYDALFNEVINIMESEGY